MTKSEKKIPLIFQTTKDSEFKVIKQSNPGDCAVCAMAMFLGIPYADIVALVPFICSKINKIQGGGLTKTEMLAIISAIDDIPPMCISIDIDVRRQRRDDWMSIIKGRKAILSAMSLNYTGVAHAVFWNGEKIIDPSNEKNYDIETINPFEIII